MRLCLDTVSKRRVLVSAVELVKHHLETLPPGGTLAKNSAYRPHGCSG